MKKTTKTSIKQIRHLPLQRFIPILNLKTFFSTPVSIENIVDMISDDIGKNFW